MTAERLSEEEVKVVEVSIKCIKEGCLGKMVYVPNTYEITGSINLVDAVHKERSTLDKITFKHRCNICNNEEYFEKCFPSIQFKKDK